MGHGRAKSTGLGVIRWTFKAILCSTALIALVIGYSIVGAFLFQAVENSFSIQNAHKSLQNRVEYLASMRALVDQLCDEIRSEKRKAFVIEYDRNATLLVANDTSDDASDATNATDSNVTTTTMTTATSSPSSLPPTSGTTQDYYSVMNITLPDVCENTTAVLDEKLRVYEVNLTITRGWRFDFRDNNLERQKWTIAEGLLFSVTVMTTIGYGNLVPKTLLGRICTMIYAMFGIPLMLLCLAYIGNIWANVLRLIYTAFYRCCQRCRRANRRRTGKMDVVKTSSKKASVNHDNTNGAVEPDPAAPADAEAEDIPVPAWLAFLILVSYIAGGSVLFSEWEGWEYKDSIYFCFVTFSTIGFGDLVPGDSISESDPQRAAACAIYILFGLATMSMVISVIQEDVIRVVYKLGNKIGFTKDKKPTG